MTKKNPTLFEKFVKPLFVYRSEKYIKVDVFIVGLFYKLMQLLAALLIFAQLYYEDAWAMTETPAGMANAWDEPGSFFTTTDDPTLAGRTQYCSNASYSFSSRNYAMEAPACESLMAAELTSKTMSSMFFTTAIIETETVGWPCFGTELQAFALGSGANTTALFAVDATLMGPAAAEANATIAAKAQQEVAACAAAATGELQVRRNDQCVCVSTRAVYPLAVEEMMMAFEHAYATSADFEWTGSSADAADGAADGGLFSRVHFPNGTMKRFEAGALLSLPLSEWLTAANVSLDELNPSVAPDDLGRRPSRRSTGVLVRVDVEYTNIDINTQRAVPGKRSMHAEISLRTELATWTGVDTQTTWVVHPSLPRDVAQEFHLVEQARHGVLFQFMTSGAVYKFDFFFLLRVLVSALVMLKLANVATDAVAFYCLPGGQSTVLRNKRQELVSKKSEFAEIGMKAALAAASYRSFDPDNNGSIEAVDIVKVFAHVEGVSAEQAHAIAHMILDDADTTDEGEVEGGQPGLSYVEYMTCLEGDAIDFDKFLKALVYKKDAPDREECQNAFEEARGKLPPIVKAARVAEGAELPDAASLPPPANGDGGGDESSSPEKKKKKKKKDGDDGGGAVPPTPGSETTDGEGSPEKKKKKKKKDGVRSDAALPEETAQTL